MDIESIADLERASVEAGTLLQEIQNYCEQNDLNWEESVEAKVRFPRGFIRTASEQRERLPFIRNKALKDNLAYTLMLSDVVLWTKIRTDLVGVPREMLTKLFAFLIGALCESITKHYLKGRCGKGYKERTLFLVEQEIISASLKEDLDWLWEIRNRMHLFLINSREYENEYDDSCHTRVVKTYRGLISALRKHDS